MAFVLKSQEAILRALLEAEGAIVVFETNSPSCVNTAVVPVIANGNSAHLHNDMQ